MTGALLYKRRNICYTAESSNVREVLSVSLMKKNGFADFARKYGWILLTCALVAVMVFIIDGKETSDPAAATFSFSKQSSGELPKWS